MGIVFDLILTEKLERTSNVSIGKLLSCAKRVHLSITWSVIVDSIPCRIFFSK